MNKNEITIPESGMIFGPYPKDDCFQIEESHAYKDCKSQHDGVKTVEFLLLRNNGKDEVLLVEAKSGSPHPKTQPEFDEFIDEIREKMEHALLFFLGMRLKRHNPSELPPNLASANLASIMIIFILVIKDHQTEWLFPLQDALNKALRGVAGAFPTNSHPFPFIAVLNDVEAEKKHLVSNPKSTGRKI